MPSTTARYALPYPVESDHPDEPTSFQALAEAVASKFVGYATGTLGGRPAAGLSGLLYKQTDDVTPVWLDDGTSWRSVGSRVVATASGDIAKIVKAATGQTADLQQWQSPTNVVLHRVDAAGNVGVAGTFQAGDATIASGIQALIKAVGSNVPVVARLGVGSSADIFQAQTGAAATLAKIGSDGTGTFPALVASPSSTGMIGLIIKAIGGQVANLQEWRDSSSAVMAQVSAAGQFNALAAQILGAAGIGGPAPFAYGSQLSVSQKDMSSIGLAVRQFSTSTQDLQNWQSAAAAAIAKVDSAGKVWGSSGQFGGWGTSPGAALNAVPVSTSQIGAIVRGAAGQSVDLQQWQDSAATVLAHLTSSGGFFSSGNVGVGTLSQFGRFSVQVDVPTSVGAAIRGAASQTNDLQQWQNSVASVLAELDASGNFWAKAVVAGRLAAAGGNGAASQAYATLTSQVVSTFRGMAGQTADLSQWQDSTSAVLARVALDGSAAFPALVVNPVNPANMPFLVKGAAAQSASLTEWRDSSSTLLASISAAGAFRSAVAGHAFGSAAGLGSNTLSAFALAASVVPFIVRGTTAQSADLTQWQNVAGQVVAKVDNTGTLIGNSGGIFSAFAQNSYPLVSKGFSGQTSPLQAWQSSAGAVLGKVDAQGHFVGGGATPNVGAGVNAGSAPPSPVITGTDQGGKITFGTGTGPGAGVQTSLAFARTYTEAFPQVVLVPINAATVALGLYVSAVTNTSFAISSTNSPVASQPNNTYGFYYIVIG